MAIASKVDKFSATLFIIVSFARFVLSMANGQWATGRNEQKDNTDVWWEKKLIKHRIIIWAWAEDCQKICVIYALCSLIKQFSCCLPAVRLFLPSLLMPILSCCEAWMWQLLVYALMATATVKRGKLALWACRLYSRVVCLTVLTWLNFITYTHTLTFFPPEWMWLPISTCC